MVRAQIKEPKVPKPDRDYISPQAATTIGASDMNNPKTPIKTAGNTSSVPADTDVKFTNSAREKDRLYVGSCFGSDDEKEADDIDQPDDWEDLMDTYTFATSSQVDLPVYVKM
jgi:hypothetical protein